VVLGALGKREGEDGRSYTPLSDAERPIVSRQVVWLITRTAVIAIALTVLLWWI
jgi:hypothetical protein